MLTNLKSKSLSIRLILVLFVVNLSSYLSFAHNLDPISTELNITVTSSSDRNVLMTAPKLLGIFADGVNDSTNILNNKKFNVDIDVNNHAQNKNKSIPMKEIVENSHIVSQNYLKSSETSDPLIDTTSEPTEEPIVLNLCKRLKFHKNNENPVSEPICVLGSPSEALYLSDNSNYDITSDDVVKNVDYYYYYIPDEDLGENIDNNSFIAFMVDVCSEPKGQVLIVDEMSGSQLMSFNNMGSTRICNHWDNDFESFVSDSNKVRIELAVPRDESMLDGPDVVPDPIDDTRKEGRRNVANHFFNMSLIYFEIEFENKTSEELNATDNHREVLYKPNSVITYKLKPEISNTKGNITVGIKIEIKRLDIDTDTGDFVLIGPGSEPSNRELSDAQIISQNIVEGEDPPKFIWVNADSAYIRLVTHNSDKKMKQGATALEFTWTPPKDTVKDVEEEKVSERIKDSAIQICVMGRMCSGFANDLENKFKEELTDITNDFLFKDDNKEGEETKKLVSTKSVLIFGEEDGIFGQREDRNNIYCQMNLAITSAFDEQWPLVSHQTLKYIFFRGQEYRDMHSSGTVRVTDCSHESISFLKMILPIIVILIVSIVLLFIAWRYQYKNWTQMQRIENSQKYMNAPVNDPNEDELYVKTNPAFVEDEEHSYESKGRTSTNRMDSVDGRPTSEHKPLGKQLSHASSTSSRKLPSVKESPEFVKNLWLSPGTSRQQNEYVFDDIHISTDDNDVSHKTRDNASKANTYSKSSGDTLTAQMPITGLNGTQHESLRSYPRSALRRPTIVSENEIQVGTDGFPIRRSSKVQFELPMKSNRIIKNTSEEDLNSESY